MTNARSLNIGDLNWTLEGWREWEWKFRRAFESVNASLPDVGPVPALVPGSVRGALTEAGLVPEPYYGLQSTASEFIEHRHWLFVTDLQDAIATCPEIHTARLYFESLDGVGEIWLNDVKLATFDNTFLPVEVDITEPLAAGNFKLTVAFTTPPADLGQLGWTSRRRAWKPRFNYGWDWTPRIVQIGIPGSIYLELNRVGRLAQCIVETAFEPTNSEMGHGTVRASMEIADAPPNCNVVVTITDHDGKIIAELKLPVSEPRTSIALDIGLVESWWQEGSVGSMYWADVTLLDSSGTVLDGKHVSVGFRDITWGVAPGTSVDGEPWVCHINSQPIFMQGINWVPIRPDYADVLDEEYRTRLELYKSLGVNMIRVWGGAALERNIFYDLCDELGLLVWQELPLCSSGLDNYPTDDGDYVADVERITRSYIDRLSHHPCVALWCGGNELSGTRDELNPPGIPLTFSHPALAAVKRVVNELNPGRKVVPTSPSGPQFARASDDHQVGMGTHDDIHGPWAHDGSREAWVRYWAEDDAVLRSEVGMAGATDRDILERYGLLAENPDERRQLWNHSASWWVTDRDDGSLEAITESQERQADLLGIAAQASKDRFPECAGFFVWMGHDSFPCPVSLAIVDFWGRPKPAALALGAIFRGGLNGEKER